MPAFACNAHMLGVASLHCALIMHVHSESPQRTEPLEPLKSRLDSLQQEKEDLCTNLDTVAALYKETLRQLESFQAEKAQKGNTLSETDNLTAEVSYYPPPPSPSPPSTKFWEDLQQRVKEIAMCIACVY